MRWLCAVALGAILLIGSAMCARAEQAKPYRVVWYSSHKCPAPSDKTAPGATPDNPISPEWFEDPISDETNLSEKAQNDGTARATSRFECKWLRLSGFFSPTHYYHYRGSLVDSAWTHYGVTSATPRYVVENFNDPKMRRSAIGHRQVQLVGQFYYLCLTAPRGDDILFLFGPCHYGGVQGMMLSDVRIEKILDDAPRYLLGDSNRSVLGQMTVVEGSVRDLMIAGVRGWAALMQRGPEAYAREAIDRNPRWEKQSADERAEAHANVVSPDSYASYLNGLPAFRGLDVARAPVEVFWREEETKDDAVGCICLQSSCTNEWPLTRDDADFFYGHAACVSLEQRDNAWIWD